MEANAQKPTLTSDEERIVQTVSALLMATDLFKEIGWGAADDGEKKIYAEPKVIFEDMVANPEDFDPSAFNYVAPFPEMKLKLETQEIMSYSNQVAMGFIKAYLIGGRKVYGKNQDVRSIL
jgi:hypothetical protein